MTLQANEPRTTRRVLENGLRVLLREDHASPIVAVNMWIHVGSVNESEEINGLAHFQEHMVFKGTEKYGVGEIASLVRGAGGNLNAGTSFSYTMYYVVLPSRQFQTALEVQADAMMHSTFDPDEFAKERLVVMDEARMYDDRPESFTFYRTMELGFARHNYRRPIAGYGPIVEKITRDQLLAFYLNYYRPSNAVLVVVGDVDTEDALARVESVYGAWQSGPVHRGQSPVEPPQETFRFKAYPGHIDHGYLGGGFHVPNILHRDYPALEMLSELLSAGNSSRLYRHVHEDKQLVTSVSASMLAEKWPGFFMCSATMMPDKWNDACAAILEEMERIKHEAPGDDELNKARRQLERGLYRELETMEGQASTLGYYELLGDYRLARRHHDAISRVTADDVQRVARRYFHPDNISLVAHVPEGGPVPATDDVEARVRAVLSRAGGVTDMSGSPDPSRVKRAPENAGSSYAPDDAGARPTVTKFTLDNGVRVLFKPRASVPLVSVVTSFAGGGRFEPPGQSGIATLTHRMLVKGTASWNAEELAARVEGLGGGVDSSAGFDTSVVSAVSLSRHLGEVMEVYREVAREPRFDAARTEQEKARLLEELAQRQDNPIQRTMDELFARAFGEHPYAHPFLGSPEEIRALDATVCARWYRELLAPENLVMMLVGDIDELHARNAAERVLGDLPATAKGPAPDRPAPAAPAFPGEHVLHRRDLRQSVVFVGYLAPPMMSDESVALGVLNGVLTGLGGRLFVELRDKRSLGYMTGSSSHPLFERSLFFAYANPGAGGVDEAVDVIQTELARVCREAVTDDELERSRNWLLGSQEMQMQRNGAQAATYATYEALGFGWEVVDRVRERIEKVTVDDIVRVASEVFVPERVVVVKMLPEG